MSYMLYVVKGRERESVRNRLGGGDVGETLLQFVFLHLYIAWISNHKEPYA